MLRIFILLLLLTAHIFGQAVGAGSGPTFGPYTGAGGISFDQLVGLWPGTDAVANTAFNWKSSPTNILLQTTAADNATWLKTNVTVTPNATTNFDGTLTADLITADANDAIIEQVWTDVGGVDYSLSMYLKDNTAGVVRLQWVDQGTALLVAEYDLTTGIATSISPALIDSSMTAIGSGWYLCTFSANSGGTDTNDLVELKVPTSGESVYFGGAIVTPGDHTATQVSTFYERIGTGQTLSDYYSSGNDLTLGANSSPGTDDPTRLVDATDEKIHGYNFDGVDDKISGVPAKGAAWTTINCNSLQCESVDSGGGKYIDGLVNAAAVEYDVTTAGGYTGVLSFFVRYSRVLSAEEELQVVTDILNTLASRGI